jgi:hypothetical protein
MTITYNYYNHVAHYQHVPTYTTTCRKRTSAFTNSKWPSTSSCTSSMVSLRIRNQQLLTLPSIRSSRPHGMRFVLLFRALFSFQVPSKKDDKPPTLCIDESIKNERLTCMQEKTMMPLKMRRQRKIEKRNPAKNAARPPAPPKCQCEEKEIENERENI